MLMDGCVSPAIRSHMSGRRRMIYALRSALDYCLERNILIGYCRKRISNHRRCHTGTRKFWASASKIFARTSRTNLRRLEMRLPSQTLATSRYLKDQTVWGAVAGTTGVSPRQIGGACYYRTPPGSKLSWSCVELFNENQCYTLFGPSSQWHEGIPCDY
jgi:hypothetical protein